MEKNMRTPEAAFNELVSTIAATSDKDLLADFLRSLLTEYELDEITKRWALVRLIDDGMSQRNIAKELGLSLCKITRGSRELKRENSAFGRMISVSKGTT
jgi:TrpR family transcriptional regulator, trp operon repressor